MTDRPAPRHRRRAIPAGRSARSCGRGCPSCVETICAPKCLSISSVWSRLASVSITVVMPGAASPASSTADLIWAEATGVRYRIGSGSRAPCSVSGSRPPSPLAPTLAPINSRGSRMRRIGRERSEASPSKIAVIGQPATAPITSRQPVPELPKSSGAGGCANPATPTPRTDQANGPVRSTFAPSACIDLAVLSTSSPSSRPEIRVSPTASAPKISARCEIDLSPGTRTFPVRGPLARASSGVGWSDWVKIVSSARAAGITWAAPRHATVGMRAERY